MAIIQPSGADWAEPVVLRPARVSDMFLLMDLADQVGYCLNPEWIRTRLRAEPAVPCSTRTGSPEGSPIVV